MLRHLLLSRRAAAAKKVSGSVRASWVFFTMIQDSRGFAMVTPDRKWHEVGEMGWWGVSFEAHEDIVDWLDHYHERFVRPYMDHMLVVVDCHI